jgi:hypothetical protein
MKNRIFELFVFMLLIGTCFVFTPNTVSAEQNGDYTYIMSNGEATITKYTGSGGSITVPSTLGGYTTVAIGYKAFYYCTTLTSITIPDNVTTIGYQAFYSCTSLSTVNIGNKVNTIGDNAFYYCTSLSSLTIPNNVTTIGYQAFYSCTSLSYIALGENLKTIGNNAFAYCSSLTNVTIPDNVTTIGYNVFAYCSSLTSVTIGNSVTSLGDTMFAYSSSLTSIIIGNSVSTIGNSVFAYCSSLVNITIPNSVTTIGENAFYYCTSLDDVTMGNGVSIIKNGAFYHCSSLTSITFLGLVAPTTVESNWISGTPDELRGHAYVSSDFPATNNIWYGLTMGTLLNGTGLYVNEPPIADFTWKPSNPNPNQAIIFDASWSYDPDGSITLLEWDWNNDGIFEESSTALTTAYTWKQSGNYSVVLRVTDNSSVNSTKTMAITIASGKETPGFELIFILFAISISILLWKKKRNT